MDDAWMGATTGVMNDYGQMEQTMHGMGAMTD